MFHTMESQTDASTPPATAYQLAVNLIQPRIDSLYKIVDMAWGAPRGVDDLIEKLKDNKTADTMCILSTRRFGPTEARALAVALATNNTLRELLASGHSLGVTEASAFGRALSSNTTLRALCLGDSSFGDEGLIALVEDGLKSNVGLLVLDLEYKSIARGDALCSLLKGHATLMDLRLGRNQLGESGIKAISLGLSQNSTLKRLDLSGNLLNGAAAQALGRAICRTSSPLPTSAVEEGEGDTNNGGVTSLPLESLDVSRNPLGDEGGAALFHALAGCLSLRSLSVSEAGLGGVAAAALAAALAPRVAPIRSGNGIGGGSINNAAGLTTVGTGVVGGGDAKLESEQASIGSSLGGREGRPVCDGDLGMHSHGYSASSSRGESMCEEGPARGLLLLRTLELSKNDFGVGGAVELAEALTRAGAPRLESLSMGYNAIGDEGAATLARSGVEGLRVLDLSGNALSGAGIGAALAAPGLREAKLFHNACGDEGVPLVLEAVLRATQLQTLDLGANGLTGAGFEALLPGLTNNPSLQTLEVGANSNDDRAEAAVRLSQSTNPGLDVAFRRGGEAMEGSGAPPAGLSIAGLGGEGGSNFPPAD